jgi:hypothetical protein
MRRTEWKSSLGLSLKLKVGFGQKVAGKWDFDKYGLPNGTYIDTSVPNYCIYTSI